MQRRLARRVACTHEGCVQLLARARITAFGTGTTAAARSGGRMITCRDGRGGLPRHGERFALPHDAAGEGRTCGARELNGEVMAEQCGVPRHEYRAEVPRARHEHRLATARLALHEHLVTRAERAQVPGARTGAHR